ncbi:Protein CBG24537 [Caenorhabditis briggsae]|uniref:Protein CBG24537 n=1 Tax=Caenorhabditis briggsae TaxID=6238 RepID=A8WKX7_CAEBR|nr:Protein CBG24537 [Caenorhabditis briggsae]CAP21122.1 Protein CBG24537 [Caenorhabditis briggsae]
MKAEQYQCFVPGSAKSSCDRDYLLISLSLSLSYPPSRRGVVEELRDNYGKCVPQFVQECITFALDMDECGGQRSLYLDGNEWIRPSGANRFFRISYPPNQGSADEDGLNTWSIERSANASNSDIQPIFSQKEYLKKQLLPEEEKKTNHLKTGEKEAHDVCPIFRYLWKQNVTLNGGEVESMKRERGSIIASFFDRPIFSQKECLKKQLLPEEEEKNESPENWREGSSHHMSPLQWSKVQLLVWIRSKDLSAEVSGNVSVGSRSPSG